MIPHPFGIAKGCREIYPSAIQEGISDMSNNESSQPDVERIMKDIRRAADEASNAVPAAHRAALADEDQLHRQLAEANRTCVTGQSVGGWRRLFLKPLAPWRSDINTFNGAVVRVLNRLVRVLEGEDLPEAGPLLDQQKRRLTLMEKMSDRLNELEARVKELERNRPG